MSMEHCSESYPLRESHRRHEEAGLHCLAALMPEAGRVSCASTDRDDEEVSETQS
jgi:hypothetical protein